MTGLITVSQNNLPATLEDLSKFVLIGRDKLQAVRAEISAIKKLEMAQEVREQKLLEGQEIGALVLMAEAKIGQLFNELPKDSGGDRRSEIFKFRPASNFENTESGIETIDVEIVDEPPPVKPKLEVARNLGFSKDQVSQFQKLADNPDAVQKTIAQAKDNGEIPTRANVMNEIKQAKRQEKAEKQESARQENIAKIEKISTPLDALGLFQTIVIDPPWDWSDEGDVNQFGRAKPEYSTMPFEDIKKMPVNKIADTNCHLYLWVTNRSLPKAFELIDAWGFRYITCLTWIKPSIGMGNYFRGSTEQVLFAVKGSQPLKRHDVGTYFNAPRGDKHSSKPAEFYALVESCSYAPFVDIFGRRERENWAVWGENDVASL